VNTKYPLSPDEFKTIYSKVPRLCVDLVIQSDEGILMTKRTLPSWFGMWHLPGGTIFYKEAVEQAAKRIAKDEVGLIVQIEKLLGYMEISSEEKGYGWGVNLELLCTIVSGMPVESEQGTTPTFFSKLPEPMVAEQKAFLLKNFPSLH